MVCSGFVCTILRIDYRGSRASHVKAHNVLRHSSVHADAWVGDCSIGSNALNSAHRMTRTDSTDKSTIKSPLKKPYVATGMSAKSPIRSVCRGVGMRICR